ncbi:transmembrane protein 54 isoform X2 [Ornithorhynchus anatinus]|uniref:transmembrane protein 54 isoform X2 n=1 Tax=Ornithorhynchus anatinus TaxID=9258 RepID=UPI0010A832B5|nr:transmembrane protein 54 isoform X2 [Ornithorhynchus anatinus]
MFGLPTLSLRCLGCCQVGVGFTGGLSVGGGKSVRQSNTCPRVLPRCRELSRYPQCLKMTLLSVKRICQLMRESCHHENDGLNFPEEARDRAEPVLNHPQAGLPLKGGRSLGAYRKILMKTGLVLIVLGHISFIAGALVHGMVLRYMMDTHDAVTLQYSISNILAVTSALLIISCGITAIVLSRYLSRTPLRWAVFIMSLTSALFSVTCALGLLASIAITFANQGQSLLATCSFSSPELAQFSPDCPFDPTRIYSSTLCLWGISLVLEVAESIFSVRCAQLIHQLLELKPWWGKSSTRMHPDSSGETEAQRG